MGLGLLAEALRRRELEPLVRATILSIARKLIMVVRRRGLGSMRCTRTDPTRTIRAAAQTTFQNGKSRTVSPKN